MNNRTLLRLSILTFVLCGSSPAWAASLSGTISDSGGTALANMEVRLWAPTPKGYDIDTLTITAADGTYSFPTIAAGDYKLDARMAPGVDAHYGDTWYDVAPPSSNGLFSDDADVLNIAASDVLTGYDITLSDTGGFHGLVRDAGMLAIPGMAVRAESTTDFRYRHTDFTKGPPPRTGEFSMRGLWSTANGHSYRILVYDVSGTHAMQVVPGPFMVVDGTDPDIGIFDLTLMGADPNEPNNSAASGTAATLPFQSTGAIIAPLGSDVDWYCLDVNDGDRLIARVDTTVNIDGVMRPHPWLDPILGLYTGDGATLLMSNDDEVPGSVFTPLVDTGLLSAGRYCFNVSTFGDSNWTGLGQQSTGPYVVDVQMGNRSPALMVSIGGNPVAPVIQSDEGVQITFDMQWNDPDGDMTMTDVTLVDANGNPVMGTFTNNGSDGTFVWTPSQTAAQFGPYEVVFTVTDGEFVAEVRVTIIVNAVNVAPSVPVLSSPIGGVRVTVDMVPLVVENSTDVDLDPLTYDYQVDIDVNDEVPEFSTVLVPEDPLGFTTWTTSALPENSIVFWRARADDGTGPAGYSMWASWESFIVDTINEAPGAPQITKPLEGEVVPVANPRIAALVPVDPEGNDMVLRFQVDFDPDFGNPIASSPDVPATPMSTTVEWTTDPPLIPGEWYYARAEAQDIYGAVSPWSNPVSFRIQPEEFPDTPGWTGEFAMFCYEGLFTLTTKPTTITVLNVDGTGAAVNIEFEILGEEDVVLFSTVVPQSEGTTTEIPVDLSSLEENGGYRFRIRAVRGDVAEEWLICTLVFDATDDPPTQLEIVSPADGFEFAMPADVAVSVTNPWDPDPEAEQLDMRVCVSATDDWADCPGDVNMWEQVLYDGPGESAPAIPAVQPGETRHVRACALVPGTNACTMEDTVFFTVASDGGGGGGTNNGTGGSDPGEPDGCGCATSGNDVDVTSIALLLLALVGSRRRRRGR